MKININSICKVKLTESGIEQLMRQSYFDYMYNFDRETQTLTAELWCVMYVFGEMLFMTQMNIPFENNEIEILE